MSVTSDVTYINKTKSKNKLWCKVCNYLLVTSEDIERSKKNKCCEECWMTFGQSRKEEWKNGWRPDKETLRRYNLKRRILNVKLTDILGD